MPLTDREIRAATKAAKAYRMGDGGGLHLRVMPSGSKLWQYRYEFGGAERTFSIGQYPDVSLAEARRARDAARELVREGKDPGIENRIARANRIASGEVTFEAVARAWHAQQLGQWVGRHANDVITSLEADVFPTIGSLPVAEITEPVVLMVLRDIEKRGAIETAHRVRQRMSAVFVHAIACGQARHDPAAVVKKALRAVERGRQPALVDLEEVRQLLRDVAAEAAHPVTKLAIWLQALTVVRPGELAAAPWAEFQRLDDASQALWTIPAPRMKMKRDHLVPISAEAVAVLQALHQVTGAGQLLFPNVRSARRPMSENAMGYLLNRAGYHGRHVPHGFRSSFSTIMNERHRNDHDRAVIDLMLAHAPNNRVEAAYNRALHLERRRELAQEWATILMDGLPLPAELLEGPRRPLKRVRLAAASPSAAPALPARGRRAA